MNEVIICFCVVIYLIIAFAFSRLVFGPRDSLAEHPELFMIFLLVGIAWPLLTPPIAGWLIGGWVDHRFFRGP